MRRNRLLILILIFINITVFGQIITTPILIDSIVIQKNWRTKDKIILNEINFSEGDVVSDKMMKESITKIWNINNFTNVSYTIDTLENKKVLLTIKAKDAFTIMPILSFSGSGKDFTFQVGVSDNNMLGRNIGMSFVYSSGTYGNSFNFGCSIPRQLLYKNMTLHANVSSGFGVKNRYDSNREQISSVGYRYKSISGSIGNPHHTDFEYTFSPNLSWSLFQHETDSTLATPEIPRSKDYTVKYLSIGISESIGIINRKRHQEDGYSISVSTSFGIGLDSESPYCQSFGLSGSYNKLFNKVVQFSSSFSTGYTTSNVESLNNNLGSGNVKGILQGEISGKGYYSAYVGGHFTYINKKWFALEHSIYLNWGNGNDDYLKIYTTEPIVSVGTGFNLMVPMIPWLYVKFFFTYNKKNSNWFNMTF